MDGRTGTDASMNHDWTPRELSIWRTALTFGGVLGFVAGVAAMALAWILGVMR